MAGRPSAAQDAAEKQYKKAPANAKPTARDLARKHGLSETAIFQSKWWKARTAALAAQQSEGE